MATKITITKALEEKIREAANDTDPGSTFPTLARQLVARIDDARRQKEVVTGLTAPAAVKIIRDVVGARCLPLPPNPTPLMSYLKARILFLGLEADDVERAARNAAQRWKGPVSIEWVFKKIQELMTEDGPAPQPSEAAVLTRGE